MARETVDFGIDLGTTNSCIAVSNGTETEVFKNIDEQEHTPSAVMIDGKGKLFVGRRAKEHLESDSENAYSEFKRRMGSSDVFEFKKSSRKMTPEELSAEVLKSLLEDVKYSSSEEVHAAAISIPASFELPQTNATKQAAELAGLSYSPFTAEPIIIACAYGLLTKSDRGYWMTYDIGGGTFDTSFLYISNGCVNSWDHIGDNHLGGKNIDWDIVDRILVPALLKEHALTDFNRSNIKWRGTFGKLKLNAEQARIELSRKQSVPIIIDFLCHDDQGAMVKFKYDLKRSEIEPLIEPHVVKTINMCKRLLEQKRLSTGDIEKLILAGGPTLTPILRDVLSTNLGIPLEFSVDPLTVVARGAAILATREPIPKDIIQRQPPASAG